MKKVLVVEDSPEYREMWKSFFSEKTKFEVEIPENFNSLVEMSTKVFEILLTGGFVIFDNDLRGFGKEFGCYTGSEFYQPLCNWGHWKRIAMASYDEIDGALNLSKGGREEKKCLAFLEEKAIRGECSTHYYYEIPRKFYR